MSVDEKQKERAAITEKKKVKRVKGAERQAGLLPHLRDEILAAQQLKKDLPGDGVYTEVFKHYRTGNKMNRAEVVEKKKKEMEAALAKPRNISKNQRSAKQHITSIGGAIEFRWLAAVRRMKLLPVSFERRLLIEAFKSNMNKRN